MVKMVYFSCWQLLTARHMEVILSWIGLNQNWPSCLVEWEEEEERKGEETDQGGEGEKGHKFEVITVCRGCKWPHK